ncbi:hypothetical protein [Streptomyces sp. SID13031]|uniref:hypothetical protein n=1 Tax=Streptomyces sp. SID13031 TaxID=2706046 RepID=UPI0013CAEAE3|nr:hypothetical protein [Streptomyces sp. SID13031]NEA32684.1 hypothetical protein [Streptomyces sp. SID13031]
MQTFKGRDVPPAPRVTNDGDVEERTYNYLRLSVVAVIVALGVALVIEWFSADWCFQKSISAYYYTPVQLVFVGALVAIGVCMVALWGRNAAEDAFLNLAGLLAPVVAFVPASRATRCSVVSDTGTRPTEGQAAPVDDDVIKAAHEAIDNNMGAVLVVVLLGLALTVLSRRMRPWSSGQSKSAKAAYLSSYLLALATWLVGVIVFFMDPDLLYRRAHFSAAILFFACVIVVVFASAYERTRTDEERTRGARVRAALKDRDAVVGYAMILSIPVIAATGSDYWVLLVEGTLILLFGTFWLLQTYDHWSLMPPVAPAAGLDGDGREAGPAGGGPGPEPDDSEGRREGVGAPM